MSAALQLLTRIEHDLLVTQQELADLRMDCNDAPSRDMLRKAMMAVKKVRDQIEAMLLDALDDESIP